MAEKLNIDKARTALVVIDLQKGIAAMPGEPHPSDTVISNAAKLAAAFRSNKMPVFLVRVTPSADLKDSLQPLTDNPPWKSQMAPDWADILPALAQAPSDVLITKRQWGAFYGTELDLQLRRRGITTIVLCGIATNIGVESTARAAYEHGYDQIFPEDAMSTRSKEEHDHTVKFVFQRIGRVRKTEEILTDLTA